MEHDLEYKSHVRCKGQEERGELALDARLGEGGEKGSGAGEGHES